MARSLTWSDVRGGIIAVAALAGVAYVTLRYARVGALRGDTIPLSARVSAARGILKGSGVWLSGQKVGRVTDIRFLPPSQADTSKRIEISFEILADRAEKMRSDAVAQIRPGGSMIGTPVIYLSPGTPKGRPVRAGDVIFTRAQADFEGAAGEFGAASKEFPVIINNVKVLAAQLGGTDGTVGAFLNTGFAGTDMARTRREMARLGATLSLERGTAGKLMNGELGPRVQRVMARADSVRALIGSPNTSLGRMRKDSTLLAEVADIRNELTLVRMQLTESRGTAGRIMHDSALFSAVGEAQRQMGLLFADIKKHPLRYLVF
jgi:phospholipid/cholesterol/gamma-HCH transport system substrate-binding protein